MAGGIPPGGVRFELYNDWRLIVRGLVEHPPQWYNHDEPNNAVERNDPNWFIADVVHHDHHAGTVTLSISDRSRTFIVDRNSDENVILSAERENIVLEGEPIRLHNLLNEDWRLLRQEQLYDLLQ